MNPEHYYELPPFVTAQETARKVFEVVKTIPENEQDSMIIPLLASSRHVCVHVANSWRNRGSRGAFTACLYQAIDAATETQVLLGFARDSSYIEESQWLEIEPEYDQVISQIMSMIREADKWLEIDNPQGPSSYQPRPRYQQQSGGGGGGGYSRGGGGGEGGYQPRQGGGGYSRGGGEGGGYSRGGGGGYQGGGYSRGGGGGDYNSSYPRGGGQSGQGGGNYYGGSQRRHYSAGGGAGGGYSGLPQDDGGTNQPGNN
jgi:four helix bundle protein